MFVCWCVADQATSIQSILSYNEIPDAAPASHDYVNVSERTPLITPARGPPAPSDVTVYGWPSQAGRTADPDSIGKPVGCKITYSLWLVIVKFAYQRHVILPYT